ncbi:MAG TPA: transketolase C-terminal domain-containing protein [Candidatus Binatia bacterium]|jgi:transketolase
MRNAFVRALTDAAATDPRVVLLTGDLGFKLFDEFAACYPGRFVNVGVAEATMAGVAAGLALAGKRPFIYSIAPFVTLRCYEQIRDDICYHRASVVVVGVGGGYSYGPNGPTHHALEDIAVMRVLPHMTVICPGDPAETVAAVHALLAHGGPAYLRLGRAGEPSVHEGPVAFRVGESLVIREGGDVTLLSTGNMLATTLAAADLLARRGIACEVVSMPTVKPLDVDRIDVAARTTRFLATVEEHSIVGGFGSAVAEQLAASGAAGRLWRFAAPDLFSSTCGDQAYQRRMCGLTPEAIADRLAALLAAAP